MDALRMATAVVHFRMLRSLGQFQPTQDPRVYQFQPSSHGLSQAEALPNGVPEPVSKVKVKTLIDDFSWELGVLCRQHYS